MTFISCPENNCGFCICKFKRYFYNKVFFGQERFPKFLAQERLMNVLCNGDFKILQWRQKS